MKDPATEHILQAALCMTRQCWEQGMFSYALMLTGRNQLLDMVVYDMVIRQSADGRLCNVEDTPAVTDSAFCIPAVLQTGNRLGCQDYIEAAHRNVQYLLKDAPRTSDGILFHMRGTSQIWADSAAFLPYSLVIAGHPQEGYHQLAGICDKLYLKESGLYAHILDCETGEFPDRRAWSVGVGWILTGLERTLCALPREMEEERNDLKERFLDLTEKVLSFQTQDGGFHDVMDDSETYPETETPAMIACALYAGIRDGLLDPSLKRRADEMADHVSRKTLPDGRVFDAAGSPTFDKPGTSVECQAHVLMMHALRGT